MKADAKAQRQQEKIAEEERQRPLIEMVQNLWTRFGTARRDAKKSVKKCVEAVGQYPSLYDDEKYPEREQCLETMTPSTQLPYGYDITLSNINALVRVADLLGVSLDYLFCRTPNPVMNDAAPVSQQTGVEGILPAIWYPATVEPPTGAKIVVFDRNGWAEDSEYIGGGALRSESTVTWAEAVWWALAPSEGVQQMPQISGGSDENGWHPGNENPPFSMDAVAYFQIDGLDPIKKLAHWNGYAWKFSKDGASIDAQCLRWFPIPTEGGAGE